ncbi:MAG: hypothetical protein RLZZ385_217 [Pseudomonadota bacterium]|jgi:ADP-ribosylglycohydrolase
MSLTLFSQRAIAALQTAFIADALAMPVHWYYNPMDIQRQFPGGIQGMAAAPEQHPSSIMSLHATRHGGRRGTKAGGAQAEIVGDVILKGRRQHWNQPYRHYHHGMQAGENTLNAHCARVLMRSIAGRGGHYDRHDFLQDYIRFMTADPPRHGDTYAESYHRGFFANLQAGLPPERCGAVTHDTPSIGGLVSVAPLVFALRLRGVPLTDVQLTVRDHLWLTHPDESLAKVGQAYVELLDNLLFRKADQSAAALIADCARTSVGLRLPDLVSRARSDNEVVGGKFSTACYISGAWPSVLYLAYKYADDPCRALLANCNLGGDNVHRGAVLGALLGLLDDAAVTRWFHELTAAEELAGEITALCQTTDLSD